MTTNAMVFETTVTDEHLLRYSLPASLPTGSRLRVVIEPLPAPAALTPLEQKLRAIRQRALANGLKPQSVESIIEEVRQGRAEISDDHNLC